MGEFTTFLHCVSICREVHSIEFIMKNMILMLLCGLMMPTFGVAQAQPIPPTPPPFPDYVQGCASCGECLWLLEIEVTPGTPMNVQDPWSISLTEWHLYGGVFWGEPMAAGGASDYTTWQEARCSGSSNEKVKYTLSHMKTCASCRNTIVGGAVVQQLSAYIAGASQPHSKATMSIEGEASYTAKWNMQEKFNLLSDACNLLQVTETGSSTGPTFSGNVGIGARGPQGGITITPGGTFTTAPNGRPYNAQLAKDIKAGTSEVLELLGDVSVEMYANGFLLGPAMSFASSHVSIYDSAHNTVLEWTCFCQNSCVTLSGANTAANGGTTGGKQQQGGTTTKPTGGTTGGKQQQGGTTTKPTGGTTSRPTGTFKLPGSGGSIRSGGELPTSRPTNSTSGGENH